MGTVVRHISYGIGTVQSISDKYIEISFGENVRKYQFPKAFDSYLETDDKELLQKIADAKGKEEQEQEPRNISLKTIPSQVPAQPQMKHTQYSGHSFKRNVVSQLLGPRSQTIPVHSESEMYELVGYIATPGRVGSFEAEVPKDGRDDVFERLFPGQTYRPIEMGYTPSGMPNKLSPQFRINFLNLRNCPAVLKSNIGKGNSSCVGRINKSKFVLDLVQNYGFQFGDLQDTNQIRAIAKERGYLEDFNRGYNL